MTKHQRIMRQHLETLFCGVHDAHAKTVFLHRRDKAILWHNWRENWATLRYFSVTEYAPHLIRLRNDLLVFPRPHWWPWELPRWRSFELTFHESEITRELGRQMHAFCEALTPNRIAPDFRWPLFDGETAFPQYAWTKTAMAFYEAHK